MAFRLMTMHHHTKLGHVTKGSAEQMILSRQTLIEILNRRCDRDLEHSGEGWGVGVGVGGVYIITKRVTGR